ncbi:MAG: VCBS repeat-containing protein, partial [Pirellulaceae bacterium]|nr:VCBS repeat-containing protein [Pirellulaceae bacterium]
VRVFLNQQNERTARFAQGIDPGLPPIEQHRTMVADINGDGDDDLFIASTVGSCFVERSFLSGGYAKAKLILFEQKQGR